MSEPFLKVLPHTLSIFQFPSRQLGQCCTIHPGSERGKGALWTPETKEEALTLFSTVWRTSPTQGALFSNHPAAHCSRASASPPLLEKPPTVLPCVIIVTPSMAAPCGDGPGVFCSRSDLLDSCYLFKLWCCWRGRTGRCDASFVSPQPSVAHPFEGHVCANQKRWLGQTFFGVGSFFIPEPHVWCISLEKFNTGAVRKHEPERNRATEDGRKTTGVASGFIPLQWILEGISWQGWRDAKCGSSQGMQQCNGSVLAPRGHLLGFLLCPWVRCIPCCTPLQVSLVIHPWIVWGDAWGQRGAPRQETYAAEHRPPPFFHG